MYLTYLDESGDPGLRGPSRYFVVNALMVHETEWLSALDQLVQLRRDLKANWGIPVRDELKSEHFRWGHGPMKGIHLKDRFRVFRAVMDYQAKTVSAMTFAIAIDKHKLSIGQDAREFAFRFTLQRIDRTCNTRSERAIVFPDEGHGVFLRKLVRKNRRHQAIGGHFGGLLKLPMERIIEDPHDKHSQDSFFTQACDWNAYAAHRSSYVDPSRKVPSDLWDRLGPMIFTKVNSVRGGPPGIVIWP